MKKQTIESPGLGFGPLVPSKRELDGSVKDRESPRQRHPDRYLSKAEHLEKLTGIKQRK